MAPNLPMNSTQIVTSSQSPSRQGASVPHLQPCQTHILSKWLHGVAGGTAGVMAAPGAGGAAAPLEGDANSTESALWEGSAQLFFFFPFFQWAMEMMTSECMWLQLPWKRTQAARSAGCAAEQCAVSTASWDVL